MPKMKKTKTISIRIDERTEKKLKTLADLYGQGYSEVIRNMIRADYFYQSLVQKNLRCL